MPQRGNPINHTIYDLVEIHEELKKFLHFKVIEPLIGKALKQIYLAIEICEKKKKDYR